jgi:oligopeptide/dipeptide ABC transporter ATP-binding protein
MPDPLLSVDDLRVVFPTPHGEVHAVSGVSFDVPRGGIFGIVGESGCGKTVTGRSILRLVPPPGRITGGRILFDGTDLLGASEAEMRQIRGRRIAMVFQDPATALNPLFTIGAQLEAIMKRHKIASGTELRDREMEILADLGLPDPADLLKTYPHQLSGGMQQRAMIAMALSTEPDLIIADEPTSALDVTIQSQILELLVRLREERGVTIIMITHDLGVVAETCDEVAVFYLGKIAEQGSVRDIFHRTQHPYTSGLLAALPNPQRWGKELMAIAGSVPTNIDILPGCPFEPRCPERMEICDQTMPLEVEVGSRHRVSCYLYTREQALEAGV